jgi:histidinol-phosphate aminotransferase
MIMSDFPTPKSKILEINNYVPGRNFAPKGVKTIKLSSNESPLGASPKAIAAYKEAADNLANYPDASSLDLRQALAKKHEIEANNIIIGAGSDELLHLLAQTYLGEGDEAIMSEFAFLVYPIITKGAGATPIFAKAKNYSANVDAILAAITNKTKIIFLDNPNNPSGTYLNIDELNRLHSSMPPNILLVIDSAYAEYANASDYKAGYDLVSNNENVVMVRTFSKIGLAALRLGWLYGSDVLVDAINRLRGPFNVNMAAQAAGIAALDDDDFTNKLVANNQKWRKWLSDKLSQNNKLTVLPSMGNFITVLFPNEEGLNAQNADLALLEKGLVTRSLASYGLANALRISIGEEKAMRLLEKTLKDFTSGNENV